MIAGTFAFSDCGVARHNNQDAYLCDPANGIFAVADGLGGLPNGERASRLTLDILAKRLRTANPDALGELLAEVNADVREIGLELDPAGFGTTLTLVRLDRKKKRLQMAHVGDCGAYLVRSGCLQLLSIEHTVAARMNSHGEEDDDIPAIAFHTLTQCMGSFPYIEPQVLEMEYHAGDRFFLFTDGVIKSIVPKRLELELLRHATLEKICQSLSFMVEAAGSPDNYTMVAFECS